MPHPIFSPSLSQFVFVFENILIIQEFFTQGQEIASKSSNEPFEIEQFGEKTHHFYFKLRWVMDLQESLKIFFNSVLKAEITFFDTTSLPKNFIIRDTFY